MKTITRVLSVFALLILSCNVAFANVSDKSSFSQALLGKSSQQKIAAINWLVANQPEDEVKPILTAWLNGQLYYFEPAQQPENALYIIEDIKQQSEAINGWDGSVLTIENRRDFDKVRVNNKLRSVIRTELATLRLNSTQAQTRAAAVIELLSESDQEVIDLLAKRQAVETDATVIELLNLALAINTAKSGTGAERIEAITTLADYKQPEVYKTLAGLLSSETDPDVQAAAKRSLDAYQQSQSLYSGVETLFFGLSLGSVLVLAGIGLAITFGVMGVINMAHGELIMIGAYTTYVLQQLMPAMPGVALVLSIPAAFVVSGLVGIAIERSVIRHLYGRPLETLLATFGISLILQQAVRSIFSPLNRSVTTPDWMSGALQINPMLSITYNRLYIVLFCAMVFIGLVMILKKTPLGLQVRAVSQNRAMARAMGIHSERVDALTFGLGSGVAGIAGVALSQLTNVGPNMGQAYIIDSFMVVVFGGVGNLWGTLVAGLGLGLFNKVLEPWAGAVMAKILMLVFIILFIQKRPRGLFPQRGRAAEG
ncbi:urea ABC transporter permease subunit UrtB [Vibrio sp.]|uniref:urea ABC transporter permease subunit UrtB n=1 Tax=Vibrio sp. TaxID=678 RepID=UPI003D0BE579